MKTNYLLKISLFIVLLSTTVPSWSNSSVPEPAAVVTHEKGDKELAEELVMRLEEIRAMDTRSLSKAERKQLRREVKDIEKKLAQISGGIYLSVGALIIIILLLILLL